VARGDASGSVREISYQTRDGGVIFGNLYGEGPHAVLLGDGVIFDKESWDHLAARLAAEGHTALAIDFRGYGESKAGQSRGGLDEDIIGGVRYLREQGAARVSVIGLSMGGGAVGDAVTPLAGATAGQKALHRVRWRRVEIVGREAVPGSRRAKGADDSSWQRATGSRSAPNPALCWATQDFVCWTSPIRISAAAAQEPTTC